MESQYGTLEQLSISVKTLTFPTAMTSPAGQSAVSAG